ncbi:pyrazinamidase/nicotinamidase [Acrasis kona]|uniref:nicotinamidase n=1 Tax=Acrasis kona TaxID=1008807 RepID=A0AAW2Z6S4_9EUKA
MLSYLGLFLELLLFAFTSNLSGRTQQNDGRALLIIDVQRDFSAKGSLAVPGGEQVASVFNNLRDKVKFNRVFLTKDWHPHNHVSFARTHNATQFTEITLPNGKKQMMWPVHCIQNSMGAGFVEDLKVLSSDRIVYKGTNVNVDSYSGFFDNDGKSQTDLDQQLKKFGIKSLYIGGLALDVCVTYTCLDAIKLGYETFLILDASRGLGEAQNKEAINKLKNAGVKIINSIDLINQ